MEIRKYPFSESRESQSERMVLVFLRSPLETEERQYGVGGQRKVFEVQSRTRLLCEGINQILM